MRRVAFFVLPLCLLLLLLAPAAAQAAPKRTFDQAIDRLIARGYPQSVDAHIAAMGTNPMLGFRWAGSTADNQSARYIAAQLRAAGLKNVHLEPVPVDVFDFRWADVKVGGRTMTASTAAGIPPTPRAGLSGRVVYVHDGTAADYAGLNVKGKLVLVDLDLDSWWYNFIAAEATLRGAKGVIMTRGPDSGDWYSIAPDALGSNDGEYDMHFVPLVYISQADGDWLRAKLADGPVSATMRLIEKVRMATDGGHGYNVFGDIPGRGKDGSFVLFDAHHDAHFHSATDDTAGVASNLAIAKAMVMSGYRPRHTMRFMFVTGEEFGYTNAWYDWCIGAWWQITHADPGWAGRIRGLINDDQIQGYGPLTVSATPELVPWLKSEGAAEAGLIPQGFSVDTAVDLPDFSWQDAWTFAAAGVPGMAFESDGKPGSAGNYHSNYMTAKWLDWPGMAQQAKFMERIAVGFDTGIAPYDLTARADELTGTVVPGDLLGAGAKPAVVSRLTGDLAAFKTASAAYEARKGSIAAGHDGAVNRSLRHIEKTLDSSLTALSAFDTTIYPHQQVLSDVQSFDQAITALEQSPADTATALDALSNVGLTWYGLAFSHPVYTYDLTRRVPSYRRVTWGGQGHLVHFFDVTPQYGAIQSGTWTAKTIDQLKAMRAIDARDLNARLKAISSTLETVTPQIGSLK